MECIFSEATISETQIMYPHRTYHAIPVPLLALHSLSFPLHRLTISLARDIVMSTPTIYKHGAVFIIFPLKQASKILGEKDANYIRSTLMEIGQEIPVALIVAAGIQSVDTVR